jgi:deoxyribodipyrimidine photolyase-related protein
VVLSSERLKGEGMKSLIVIFPDQLSLKMSSLKSRTPANADIYMAEWMDLKRGVRHHQKKLVFIFSCMRHFANDLKALGWQVHYKQFDQIREVNLESLVGCAIDEIKPKEVVYTLPSEYHDQIAMQTLLEQRAVAKFVLEDDRFLCSYQEFAVYAEGKKQLRMEFFYRMMRKKYQILMEKDEPVGGKWNFDGDNRQVLDDRVVIPPVDQFEIDEITAQVIEGVCERFGDHFGDIMPFFYAVRRIDALKVLNHFVNARLSVFGQYQDVMKTGEPWLFHAHISWYLNVGLLLPKECIDAVLVAYHQGKCPLNSAEGFVRQILGWREFVRGIYGLKMPEYRHGNFLEAKASLPDFYWTGKTSMNCMSQCVAQTKKYGYAHHIQRLMVLGNFALLAGIAPDAVNQWYWIVYMDAFEWVELPNVSGMILFADGGYLASKPYAAGGAYINKMSDYCKNCVFSVKEKAGKSACPFNYLYWNFLLKHQGVFQNNPRMAMMYRQLKNMNLERLEQIQRDSDVFLKGLHVGLQDQYWK